jgi:transposase
MNGARKRWSRLVRRWRRSGQTAREFAAGAGINPGTLVYWASRLKREGSGTEQQGVDRHDSKGEGKRGRFVELIAGPIEERRFEIELVDGRRLRVPPDFDAAALGRLLTVLGSTAR